MTEEQQPWSILVGRLLICILILYVFPMLVLSANARLRPLDMLLALPMAIFYTVIFLSLIAGELVGADIAESSRWLLFSVSTLSLVTVVGLSYLVGRLLRASTWLSLLGGVFIVEMLSVAVWLLVWSRMT